MTKVREKAIKLYWKIAKERCPFHEEEMVHSFLEGFINCAEYLLLRDTGLEKENSELKADNDARKFAMAMSENVEKQLREENAELKEKLKPENCLKLLAKEGYIKFTSDNLTKAIELIKRLMHELVVSNIPYDEVELLVKDVEQFLSEVEK